MNIYLFGKSTLVMFLRNMFGTDAYITFTMDKIITTLGRQLQAMFTEEVFLFPSFFPFEISVNYELCSFWKTMKGGN